MSEKAIKLQEQLDKLIADIKLKQEKAEDIRKKIKVEQELEVKKLITTIDIPFDELAEMLKKMKEGKNSNGK